MPITNTPLSQPNNKPNNINDLGLMADLMISQDTLEQNIIDVVSFLQSTDKENSGIYEPTARCLKVLLSKYLTRLYEKDEIEVIDSQDRSINDIATILCKLY